MNIAKCQSLLALTVLLLLGSTHTLRAQGRSIPVSSEVKEEEQHDVPEQLPEGQKYRYGLWHGLSLSTDMLDPALRLVTMGHASYEVQAMLDLHHRFFPMATFGMGMANKESDNGLDYGTTSAQELRFKSSLAPFGKLGIAYGFDYNSTRPHDYYMAFFRYGIATNKADITNLYYANDNWGAMGPVAILDQRYVTQWVELGGMIKVQIAGPVSLGWDLYLKVKVAQSGTTLGKPYFVPGYGTSKAPFGFSFRLYYDIF